MIPRLLIVLLAMLFGAATSSMPHTSVADDANSPQLWNFDGDSLGSLIEIEVDERANSGQVKAEFVEGTDQYRIVFTQFAGVTPYQSGGIATRAYEHGDSGNGDTLYPKTWLYLAGWGKADVFKNGQLLYRDYAAHFMVMERSRDPKIHEVRYPMKRSLPGGETDPAGMEIDLWVRSAETNTQNFPPFETFIHLYWKEVTWK